MDQWRGCVALVTGASRGIGEQICRELYKHGVKVVGCAKNEKPIEDLAKELASTSVENRGELRAVKCDVSKESDVKDMFTFVRENYGVIHICINNAGVILNAPLLSGKTEQWREIMEVNVLGTCICTREAVELMTKGGVIIQMGCIGGHKIPSIPRGVPDVGVAVYNGTKFMVRALAEALRQELKLKNELMGHKIRVSTISPGPVNTNMVEVLKKANQPDGSASSIPDESQRLQTKEIVEAVLYILKAPDTVNVDDIVVQHVSFHV